MLSKPRQDRRAEFWYTFGQLFISDISITLKTMSHEETGVRMLNTEPEKELLGEGPNGRVVQGACPDRRATWTDGC